MSVGSTVEVAPVEVEEPSTDLDTENPWVVIVWNDPINLMEYVAYVFRKLFGFSKEEANRRMMQVHVDGKAVVSTGAKERCEMDVFRLHEHGLWATMQQD
jgi:ATP-dependent Clp protease adaptor protein ClpS